MVIIFISFLVTIILQKGFAATYKITILLNRSWEELLSAIISQLSNTYKPNYKELEIELLGTFFLEHDGSHTSETRYKCLPTKCSGHFSICFCIFAVVTITATNSGIPTLCDNISTKWFKQNVGRHFHSLQVKYRGHALY